MASTKWMSFQLIPRVWSEETISWVPNPDRPNAVSAKIFFLTLHRALGTPAERQRELAAWNACQLMAGEGVKLEVPWHLYGLVMGATPEGVHAE